MVLDVAELLLKHSAAKAKGVTINVTPSPQPLLRQILTSQPSSHRPYQDSPPKSEFLSEVCARSGIASCNAATAVWIWFWSDCHSRHAWILLWSWLCFFTSALLTFYSELAAIHCKHMKPLGQCIKALTMYSKCHNEKVWHTLFHKKKNIFGLWYSMPQNVPSASQKRWLIRCRISKQANN